MPVEYLDSSIDEGVHAEKWVPPAWAADVPDGEEWQPDIEPPRINDYAAFKKHKHYGKYFRPYRYVPFPAWMHHKTMESKLCQTKEEVAALGPEWSREPQRRFIDMTGKALPIKTDTQRLAETIALGLDGQRAQISHGTIDPTMIAAIVAAVMAAIPAQPAVAAAPVIVDEGEVLESTLDDGGTSTSIERAAMIELATTTGVKIDKRWSDERIKQALGL